MSSPANRTLLDYFADLEDPRVDRTKEHPLINVVFIAVCAVIAGGEGWSDMETFGQSKRRWLARFLDVSKGTPSDDTFRRVISRLDPRAFEDRFRRWTAAVVQRAGDVGEEEVEGEHIALDGKTLRGSADRDRERVRRTGEAKAPIQLVSAWAKEKRLTLAQETVEEGTNEISALPDVLEALELSGALVTIDAIGTQKEIAEQIETQEGEYVLALIRPGAKEQPPTALRRCEVVFRRCSRPRPPGHGPQRKLRNRRRTRASGGAPVLDDRRHRLARRPRPVAGPT